MRRLTVLAVTLGLLWMTGCCGPARYWKATDINTGRVFYTADTEGTPVSDLRSPVFVSSDGKIVGLSSYELELVGEAEWRGESGASVEVKSMWIDDVIKCKALITPANAPPKPDEYLIVD